MPDGDTDTVAAIATATAQRAGIGIVRISGPQTRTIAGTLLGAAVPVARQAVLRDFFAADGAVIDRGLALFFPLPGSYTGEDVLELHAHGGLYVLNSLLQRVIDLGARRARPGEFTERAFLNGRMDLLQAEAVADLIDAADAHAARAAHATLRGDFSRRVVSITDALTQARVQLEAGLDFSEEELGGEHVDSLSQQLRALLEALDDLLLHAERGVRLRDGLRVVLVGAPNVGKSSVLNRLAGEERAIVTEIPGTTRDVIRESIHLAGASIELMDTAGLRESVDLVEQIGMARTLDSARHADLVLLVCDDQDDFKAGDRAVETDGDVLTIFNKTDLSGGDAGVRGNGVAVSAATGAGFDALREELVRRCAHGDVSGEFSARQRHLECLREGRIHLLAACQIVEQGHLIELCAEDLRQCQLALGKVTGAVSSDDLLGEIFSSFCIGK